MVGISLDEALRLAQLIASLAGIAIRFIPDRQPRKESTDKA